MGGSCREGVLIIEGVLVVALVKNSPPCQPNSFT